MILVNLNIYCTHEEHTHKICRLKYPILYGALNHDSYCTLTLSTWSRSAFTLYNIIDWLNIWCQPKGWMEVKNQYGKKWKYFHFETSNPLSRVVVCIHRPVSVGARVGVFTAPLPDEIDPALCVTDIQTWDRFLRWDYWSCSSDKELPGFRSIVTQRLSLILWYFDTYCNIQEVLNDFIQVESDFQRRWSMFKGLQAFERVFHLCRHNKRFYSVWTTKWINTKSAKTQSSVFCSSSCCGKTTELVGPALLFPAVFHSCGSECEK